MIVLSRRSFLTGAALVGGALVVPELWTPSRTFFLPPRGGWISRFNPAYPRGDIRRYGAVLDGLTDDTEALQAAIDDCALWNALDTHGSYEARYSHGVLIPAGGVIMYVKPKERVGG